jgi:hypothetical protein
MALAFYFSPTEPGSFAASLLFACSVRAVGLCSPGWRRSPCSSGVIAGRSGMAGAVHARACRARARRHVVRAGWRSRLAVVAVPLRMVAAAAALTLEGVAAGPLPRRCLLLAIAGSRCSPARSARRESADRLGSAVAPSWLRGSLSLAFVCTIGAAVVVASRFCWEESLRSLRAAVAEKRGRAAAEAWSFSAATRAWSMYLGSWASTSRSWSPSRDPLEQALRGEEQAWRPSRARGGRLPHRWRLSLGPRHALGALWLLTLAGLGTVSGQRWPPATDSVRERAPRHVAHTPAICALLGLAVALYGLRAALARHPPGPCSRGGQR